MSTKALKLLRDGEWSMGNGQCPDCEACRPDETWHVEFVGHERECARANAIQELGGEVEWKKENKTEARRNHLAWWAATWAKIKENR